MSTVDIDSKNICIGMLRQWLNEERIKDAKHFVTNEELEVWLAPAFAHQRTTLKAELLAKMPKPKAEIQMTDYLNGVADGHNQAITEITKLVKEL